MAIEVREADFNRDRDLIRRLRCAVFVHEQHVPPEIEMDDRDDRCVHVLAVAADTPVGTGRIDLAKGGKIGRVAVLAAFRRSGVGSALMTHLHGIARVHGLPGVWCHAQRSAVPFYERLGYEPVGQPFDEAGIEHVRMEWRRAGLPPDDLRRE